MKYNISPNKIAIIALIVVLSMVIAGLYGCSQSKAVPQAILSISEGEVLVKKAGASDWVKGEIKMLLGRGDVIKSGADANALVTFFDGSTIELKLNTQIEVKELVKGKAKIIRLKQEIGDTISKVEKLVDPAARYEIETPAAVAGVRGSSMLVSVALDGTTTVKNLAGQISLTAKGAEIIIPEGGTGTVKQGETPLLELSYDDGHSDGGYSLGGPQKYGFMVQFELPVTQFRITKVKIFSWIKGTPKEQFTIRITDKNLIPLWETSLLFTLFTTSASWLEVEVPNITVADNFCVQLYAPTLGQGLGPYIGKDNSIVNEHSELLSGWEITAWTLSVPKEQSNWMIRVNGKAVTTSEP